jgi:Caspase domain
VAQALAARVPVHVGNEGNNMRKALVVGIDYYEHVNRLYGCVNDARAVRDVLERHGDGTRNFDVLLLTAAGEADGVLRTELKTAIRELFEDDHEVAVFYFAGHGYVESSSGYLLASDSTGDDGVSLAEVLDMAHASKTRYRVIVLDSCYSGVAGTRPSQPNRAELSEGLTILTASTATQYTEEWHGGGVFTNLFVDALKGSAANLVGEISTGSVYAHIDQSLGSWGQRPVFKTNTKEFFSLRRVRPRVPLDDLHALTTLFPSPDFQFPLDPSYEPESLAPNEENARTFRLLQRLNRVALVIPVGAEHMYHAAMTSKACRLTDLGEHYHRLVAQGLL